MLKSIVQGVICALICAFIFCFIVAIFPYHFVRSGTSPANGCINTLRQLDAADNEFALENGKHPGDKINFPSDLTPFIKLNSAGKIPSCPSGGTYSISRVGDKPICSLGTTITPPHVLP